VLRLELPPGRRITIDVAISIPSHLDVEERVWPPACFTLLKNSLFVQPMSTVAMEYNCSLGSVRQPDTDPPLRRPAPIRYAILNLKSA